MKKIYFIISITLSMVFSNAYAGFAPPGCNDNMMATAPDERYTNNSDGTVTDKWTGLMWKKCAEGLSEDVDGACNNGSLVSMSWQAALQHPATVNGDGGFAGHTDWRLPNIKELLSLAERKCHTPAINTTFFSVTAELNFKLWSSTPYIDDGFARNYWIAIGEIRNDATTTALPIRLVRSIN